MPNMQPIYKGYKIPYGKTAYDCSALTRLF